MAKYNLAEISKTKRTFYSVAEVLNESDDGEIISIRELVHLLKQKKTFLRRKDCAPYLDMMMEAQKTKSFKQIGSLIMIFGEDKKIFSLSEVKKMFHELVNIILDLASNKIKWFDKNKEKIIVLK